MDGRMDRSIIDSRGDPRIETVCAVYGAVGVYVVLFAGRYLAAANSQQQQQHRSDSFLVVIVIFRIVFAVLMLFQR